MAETEKKPRIVSLDMFRGFAIFGMILVNYLGHFESMPDTFRHPRYGMSFANAVAPYFLFAVGMGLRMSLARRIEKTGKKAAYMHAIKRYLVLILLGMILYGAGMKTGEWKQLLRMDMWDALVDIGFAGLITLPFILTGKTTRIAIAFGLLIVYQLLFAFTGYGAWSMPNSIDGGPLGPISWASILVFGTIQMDYLRECQPNDFIRKSLILGITLLIVGLGLSYLHPKEIWEFSQRSMTIAYPIFASGLSVLTYLVFYMAADRWKWKIPHMATLGINPLVIYVLQQVLIHFFGGYYPGDAAFWQASLGFVVIYGMCYLVARYLERNKLIIKL